jgi:hypothetical protein
MNKRTITEDHLEYVRKNHNKLSLKAMREHLKVTEARVLDLMLMACKEKSINDMYMFLPEVTRRKRYLVQLDDLCYLVHFSEPIEPRLIKYCPIRIGADYDVHPVSDYEFAEMQKGVPVVYIETDLNYQYNFWALTQTMLQGHEAR